MKLSLSLLVVGAATLAPATASRCAPRPSESCPKPKGYDAVHVDVAVIGGGASGSYAALALKDKGKKVAVIEKKDHLGGAVQTIDVAEGVALDYGVLGYASRPITFELFARFGLTSIPVQFTDLPNQYVVDFSTGTEIPVPAGVDPSAAIGLWLAKVQAVVDAGFLEAPGYNLPAAADLPAELQDVLLPFGAYVAKYPELGLLVPLIARLFYITHNLLATPTYFVMGDAGPVAFASVVSPNGYSILVNPATGGPLGNQRLYDAIEAELVKGGDDAAAILFESEVASTCRDGEGVYLTVKGSENKYVVAKQLVVAIPPVTGPDSTFAQFMDLDSKEAALFSKWNYGAQWTTLIDNPGFQAPQGTTVFNIAPQSPLFVPTNPYVSGFIPYVTSGKFITYAISDKPLTSAEVVGLTTDALEKVDAALDDVELSAPVILGPPASHSPANLHVSSETLAGGYIAGINALQGYRNTYYVGKSWTGDYSPLVWEHARAIVGTMSS